MFYGYKFTNKFKILISFCAILLEIPYKYII